MIKIIFVKDELLEWDRTFSGFRGSEIHVGRDLKINGSFYFIKLTNVPNNFGMT